MPIKRRLAAELARYHDKLVFIYGPRQSGKTYLIESHLKPDWILNMDSAADRLIFKKFPQAALDWYELSRPKDTSRKPLIFIDEIHKVQGWRNLIKGTYDKTKNQIRYVASGSSAFQLRKQDKGDSLAGRAIWLPLLPISFREWLETNEPQVHLPPPYRGEGLIECARPLLSHKEKLRKWWDIYYRFGSFPENLVKQDSVFYDQWLQDYVAAMLDKDLKDLHLAKDVERVYQVFQLLLEGIGSSFSLNSLGETLGVSPNTIKNDVLALTQVLWGFELPAAVLSKAKQIRKEKKFYPIDFCFVPQDSFGARFECAVASQLKRAFYVETTRMINRWEFGFFRDYQKREVDFVMRKGKELVFGLEAKLKFKNTDHHLSQLSFLKPKELVLVVAEPGVFTVSNGHLVISIELLAACCA